MRKHKHNLCHNTHRTICGCYPRVRVKISFSSSQYVFNTMFTQLTIKSWSCWFPGFMDLPAVNVTVMPDGYAQFSFMHPWLLYGDKIPVPKPTKKKRHNARSEVIPEFSYEVVVVSKVRLHTDSHLFMTPWGHWYSILISTACLYKRGHPKRSIVTRESARMSFWWILKRRNSAWRSRETWREWLYEARKNTAPCRQQRYLRKMVGTFLFLIQLTLFLCCYGC